MKLNSYHENKETAAFSCVTPGHCQRKPLPEQLSTCRVKSIRVVSPSGIHVSPSRINHDRLCCQGPRPRLGRVRRPAIGDHDRDYQGPLSLTGAMMQQSVQVQRPGLVSVDSEAVSANQVLSVRT